MANENTTDRLRSRSSSTRSTRRSASLRASRAIIYASIGDTVGEIGEKTRGAVRKMEIDAICKEGMCLTSKPFEAYGAFPLQGNNT